MDLLLKRRVDSLYGTQTCDLDCVFRSDCGIWGCFQSPEDRKRRAEHACVTDLRPSEVNDVNKGMNFPLYPRVRHLGP